MILPGSPDRPIASGTPQIYFHHKEITATGAPLLRPETKRVICLLPWNADRAEFSGWTKMGTVFYQDVNPRKEVAIGPYNLASSAE